MAGIDQSLPMSDRDRLSVASAYDHFTRRNMKIIYVRGRVAALRLGAPATPNRAVPGRREEPRSEIVIIVPSPSLRPASPAELPDLRCTPADFRVPPAVDWSPARRERADGRPRRLGDPGAPGLARTHELQLLR